MSDSSTNVKSRKILIVCTTDSMIWSFLIPHIEKLKSDGYSVDCACSKTGFYIDELRERHNLIVHEMNFSRSPIRLNNLSAFLELKNIINREKYELIHCHEPVGAAIGRLAGKATKIKVFYTAHGFHFYKGAPTLNWLVYYPVEKWLAKYTDTLITINKEDYDRAKRKFKAKRVEYIPGVGIDLEKFNIVETDRDLKRSELGLPKDAFVVLSVGELNKNKNHEVVIRAIWKIDNPNIHYIICGQGQLDGHLRNLSKELGIENQVHLLGFRKDIPEICKITDLFAFPSYREGLSVALMEAMANGLPVVCSNIRGNSDLIESGKGGYLVEPADVEGFTKYIKVLIEDSRLRSEFGGFNLKKIENYSIENVLKEMEEIYFN